MAIEDEMVRFIAKIDLDPEDAAAFTKGLKEANDQCEYLRGTIAETAQKMVEMRARGEENSDEFKTLKSNLEDARNELKAVTKESEKYSSALGLNQMSMKQLQQHSKQLRSALNSMSKEANPKLWEKYNNELVLTEKRMKEVRVGANEMKSPLQNLFGTLTDSFKAFKKIPTLLGGAAAVVKNIIGDMIQQTQVWGDRWAHFSSGVSAAWNQAVANIFQGGNVIKGSISDAFNTAVESSKMLDELFERENSFSLMEFDAQTYINEQRAIMNDSSRSEEERLAALKNINAKEEELKDHRKSIAEQEMTAYKAVLKQRMQLDDEALEAVLDNYEQNRQLLAPAQAYNELLAKQKELKSELKLMDSRSVGYASKTEEYVQVGRDLAAITDENTKKLAGYLKQYDLGNDEMVTNYVKAKLKFKAADVDYTAAVAANARKEGTLKNAIAKEEEDRRKKLYEDEIAATEKFFNDRLVILKEQLAKGEITEQEYNVKSETLQVHTLQTKLEVMKKYGKDTVTVNGEIADRLITVQKKIDEALKKSNSSFTAYMSSAAKSQNEGIEKMLEETEAEVQKLSDEIPAPHDYDKLFAKAKEGATTAKAKQEVADAKYNDELASLDELHELQLISEEEFLARKKVLTEEHAKETIAIQTAAAQKGLSAASSTLDSMSKMVTSLQNAELQTLEAQMQAELSAAGDNADKRAEIESKYEQKKLDTQKKYADADMAINIAKAVASGALATLQCFAQLGPIPGAVAAAIIAVTTAAEIASIVAQRNAIKNTSASGASSSSSSVTRKVNGFSEGGYTGDGGRLEVAGVVHRGEYVVPKPEMSDPSVAAMVAAIETKRRRRTSANALPGFAEGGYAGVAVSGRRTETLLENILAVIDRQSQTPVPAYVVLSDLQAKQELMNSIRRESSLK